MRLIVGRAVIVTLMVYLMGCITGSIPIVETFQEHPGYAWPIVGLITAAALSLGVLTTWLTVLDVRAISRKD